MDFYGTLANNYDEIFTIKEPQKRFLKDYLESNKIISILDVGCGTGSYALEMSSWGIKTAGIDLSSDMINLAKQKALQEHSPVQFYVLDMMNILSISEDFNGISCLGNTLVHLTSEQEIIKALKVFRAKSSHLLIQIVNYDKILKNNIKELPIIQTENLVFYRFYKHLPNGLIDFSMELDIFDQPSKTLTANNLLFPVTKNMLEEMLKVSGWEVSSIWGSFAGDHWKNDSPATIVAAKSI